MTLNYDEREAIFKTQRLVQEMHTKIMKLSEPKQDVPKQTCRWCDDSGLETRCCRPVPCDCSAGDRYRNYIKQ